MAENRGPQVAAVAILFITLSWVSVSLRCYVRTFMMKSFGMDDWLAVASLMLFTLYCTFVLEGVQYGTGQHLADIPAEHIPIALKWWWCCELAYVASTAVLKASIGVFLLRICIKKSQKVIIWVVMSVVVLFSIIYFFLLVFQCSPVTYFWTQYSGGAGKCFSPSFVANSTYAHSAVSVWADWTLGILPIFLVWNLAMNPRTKVSVAFILAFGAVGSTATVVRIPYINQLTLGDFLYGTTDVAIWSTVEAGIGVTSAAMATLRPLFRTFLSRPKLLGSSTREPAGGNTWPLSRKPGRAAYYRSGNGQQDDSEELELRGDISKGVGVTTVIKSMSNPDAEDEEMSKSRRIERSGSQQVPKNNMSEMHLGEDSSEEFFPFQQPGSGWGQVWKKTEVRTSED